MSKKNNGCISANYLDYIPIHNESKSFKTENGKVTIMVENTGLFNRIAQKCFKKPKFTQVHLDDMGNFIWPLIDGKKSIYDISVLVKEHFGDKCEPLYNRLVQYMITLKSYDFIRFINDTNANDLKAKSVEKNN